MDHSIHSTTPRSPRVEGESNQSHRPIATCRGFMESSGLYAQCNRNSEGGGGMNEVGLKNGLAVGVVLLGLTSYAAEIQLPPETGAFKQDTGAEIANGQCLICHSVEYVSSQP